MGWALGLDYERMIGIVFAIADDQQSGGRSE
jgi:hypothetical protein